MKVKFMGKVKKNGMSLESERNTGQGPNHVPDKNYKLESDPGLKMDSLSGIDSDIVQDTVNELRRFLEEECQTPVNKEPVTEKKTLFAKIINNRKNIFIPFYQKFKKYYLRLHKASPENLILPVIIFTMLIGYLEIILHILTYHDIDFKIIYPVLFAAPVGAFLTFLTGFFGRRINKIIIWVLISGFCFLYSVQLVYYYVFHVYFSFQSIGLAGDVMSEFGKEVKTAIGANLSGIALLILPLPLLAFILRKILSSEKRKLKNQCILFGIAVLLQIFAFTSLRIYGKEDYSPYDLYYHTKISDLCGKELGLLTMTRFDIMKLFSNEELNLVDTTSSLNYTEAASYDVTPLPTLIPTAEPTSIAKPSTNIPSITPVPSPEPTKIPVDTSPNIMNIDFAALAGKESDQTIRTLHEYFAASVPTNKNEYTGMFKGYNLIMITAEGFSPYAVNKDVTPTLYKLTHEGFVFSDFYTALWQTSTSDGEYTACTGLIPVGTRSMYKSRNNFLPFCLGNQFNRLGVKSKAYHDHSHTYYQRDETHPNMGYLFKGKGNGLELPSDVWPESDLEMMNATTKEYLSEDQFHVYYMTVSGHMNYTFVGNSMSYKNRDLVKDLPYSDDCKAYIACQVELDKALEKLIKDLEEAGVADRTVIALSSDHYPYGFEKEKIDELAGHEVDPYFEVYKNNFILWSKGMKETVVIDKPCSSLDILPTLSNLFGLEYDSRLLMGRDILSDAMPLVILSNHSFITDKVMYNSENGEVSKLTEEELPENYIKDLNKIIQNKFAVSESIRKKDYYRTLESYFE